MALAESFSNVTNVPVCVMLDMHSTAPADLSMTLSHSQQHCVSTTGEDMFLMNLL